MAERMKEYRRLPGRARSLTSSSSLWMGSDHLLLLWTSYRESYRRFSYGDIQAIVTRRTNRALAAGALSGAIAAATGAAGFFSEWPARIAWLIAAGAALLALATNALRGASCVCSLSTAAQSARLPSLNRVRTARKAIALLSERIAQAQGWLNPQEAFALAGDPSRTPAAEEPPAPAPPPLPEKIRTASGRVHMLLFASLLADGAISAVSVATENWAIFAVAMVLLLFELGLLIGALLAQRGSDLSPGVRAVVWLTLPYLCVAVSLLMSAGMTGMFAAFGQPPQGLSEWDLAIKVFSVATPFLLGGAGFAALAAHRRSREERDLSIFGGRR